MDVQTFNSVVRDQLTRCEQTLISKAEEYATEDRLHNFRTAAALQGVSMQEALSGMMAKHTISIFDMCASHQDYPEGLWNEKIGDHINYLLLLKAIVVEDQLKHTTTLKTSIAD